MVPESKLEKSEHGLVPTGDGWFVLGLRDAVWRHVDGRGAVCLALDDFEGERRPVQFGFNPFVLMPGEPMGMYHWEADQEGFLVVSGEAVLVVESDERPLRAWDFVHCPPNTKHVIVGAGSGPCTIVAVGARDRSTGPDWGGYTVDEAALRHGAGVAQETTSADEAYSQVPHRQPTRYRDGWLPD
jgi:uncharacterized cupin superfamily protein